MVSWFLCKPILFVVVRAILLFVVWCHVFCCMPILLGCHEWLSYFSLPPIPICCGRLLHHTINLLSSILPSRFLYLINIYLDPNPTKIILIWLYHLPPPPPMALQAWPAAHPYLLSLAVLAKKIFNKEINNMSNLIDKELNRSGNQIGMILQAAEV